MRVVVTGNMGCGKSTVVGIMSEMLQKYTTFDFDRCVHALYEDCGVQYQLINAFGTTTRSDIRSLAFADKAAMITLGEIFNARIMNNMKMVCDASQDVILDIPLWFEHIEPISSTFQIKIDRVVCVVCKSDAQMTRIRDRSGLDEQQIKSILAAQLPQHTKSERSDYVIDNSGLVSDTRNAVEELVIQLLWRNYLNPMEDV